MLKALITVKHLADEGAKSMVERDRIFVRDPVHGSISLSAKELELIQEPAFQRLRHIRQMGFADIAFPGATHSRYSHSLGAMHIASRVFDRLFMPGDLPKSVHNNFRQCVRLAMLFHDVGHAPLSHTTEMLMPPVRELNLPQQLVGDETRQATHEDFTVKLLLDSPLTLKVSELFSASGITPKQVALLVTDRGESCVFMHDGINYGPILRQIVTSEVDADRMDYLQRDSLYCGVNYGKFDADWLIENVIPVQKDKHLFMGIQSRAVFSFEDFLLSRYHMYASVYLHHTSVMYDTMLQKHFQSGQMDFSLPADIEAYIAQDDSDLWLALRKSQEEWAKRIVGRKPYKLLYEERDETSIMMLEKLLKESCLDYIKTHSQSVLSKYFLNSKIPLYVVNRGGETLPLEDYTPLYQRYEHPAQLHRIFVNPKDKNKANAILHSLSQE